MWTENLTLTASPWNLAKCQKHINWHISVNLRDIKMMFELLVTISKWTTYWPSTGVRYWPKTQGQILNQMLDMWKIPYKWLIDYIHTQACIHHTCAYKWFVYMLTLAFKRGKRISTIWAAFWDERYSPPIVGFLSALRTLHRIHNLGIRSDDPDFDPMHTYFLLIRF